MAVTKCISFITGHHYRSLRRAGFHNLADAAQRLGYTVNFITVAFSLLSFLRRDHRTKIPEALKERNKIIEINSRLKTYTYFTPWHPVNMIAPFMNRISTPWMHRYGQGNLGNLLSLIQNTDIFIFESTPGLFLFKRFLQEAPHAATIYRVSDDIRVLRSTHPSMLTLEKDLTPLFDCISVPSAAMLDIFAGATNVKLHSHGIDKQSYDQCTVSPYPPGTRNAIFIGTGHMDSMFLRHAAKGNPDCVIHVIGPVQADIEMPNVRFYGELLFNQTIPYVKFADVGLLNLNFRNNASKSFTDSLKTIQYSYCGLPIVAPSFLNLNRGGVFYYTPYDEPSAALALRQAINAGKTQYAAASAFSWEEIMQTMLDEALAARKPVVDFPQYKV